MWNKGHALPVVLIILALIFGTAAILLPQINFDLKINETYRDYQCCMLSGKSAFDEVEACLNQDLAYIGTDKEIMDKNEVISHIKVQIISDTARQITVECSKNKYKKEFIGKALIDPTTKKVIKMEYRLIK
ncbi:MAG: hypothetical protein RR310_03310 [Eubacterium sp.]